MDLPSDSRKDRSRRRPVPAWPGAALLLLGLFLGAGPACRSPQVVDEPVAGAACMHTLDCPDGYFCEKPGGACARAGACRLIPKHEPCTESLDGWSVVCGCDGRTYLDPCDAIKAGINIAHDGECARGVFGTCMSNDDCAEDFFCDRFFGDCLGEGICEPVPAACDDETGPVCGCDGNTYVNICAAKGSGVSIARGGACRGGDHR